MAKRQLGGFAIIASSTDLPDEDASASQINLFYAVPNPASRSQRFTLLWEVTAVPQVRVLGPGGYNSGPLPTSSTGHLVIPNGLLNTGEYTLVGLNLAGNPLVVAGVPISVNLKVTVL